MQHNPVGRGGFTAAFLANTVLRTWIVAMIAFGLFGSSAFGGARRKPAIVVVHAETNESWVADVQGKLASSGEFSSVGTFNANVGTPTLAQLLAHDAVLLSSDFSFADPVALGNNLADYVDAGGGVVNMAFSTTGFSFPAGRWPQNYQSMVGGGSVIASASTLDLGSITDQHHGILIGVRSFSGGGASFRANQNNVAPGATVVARWAGGNVLASAGPLPGRVDLNFFPPSSAVGSDFWDQSTDGIKLMVNALLYTIRPRVLVAGSVASDSWITDVKNKVRASGRIGITDTLNTRLATPTLAQLMGYDAVLAWTDSPPLNSVALGNVLADYTDAGGGVVTAMFAHGEPWRIEGRWAGTYELITVAGGTSSGSASLGIKPYPAHPAITSVSTFSGGSSSYRPGGSALNPGAFTIAQWSDGKPLVVASTKFHNRIDLGFFPPSNAVRPDFWDVATNGDKLMANAINYTVKPYIACLASDINSPEPALKIFATRRFSGIDTQDAGSLTPSVSALKPYNAILAWSFNFFSSSASLGNNLADFVDSGGGVVVAPFANVNYSIPGGRWQAEGYEITPSPVPDYSVGASHEFLGAVLEPANFVNTFVRSFDGGTGSYRATSNPLLRGREILRWSDGRMLASVHNFKKRVDLGFYPVSSGGPLGAAAWNQRTDGAWLMANALDYAVRHKPCPGDFNGDGQVDDTDFVLFAGYYDALVDPRGDLTGDGLTEDIDFVIFAGGYDALVCP